MATFPVPNGNFGDVYTEAMHQARGDGVNGVHVGELAIAGQTAGDLITATSATQLGRLPAPAVAGRFLMSASPGTAPEYSTGFTGTTVARKTVSETVTAAWTFNAGLNLATGSASAPSLQFTGDPNTGIWQSAPDRVDIATGGVNRLSIQNSGVSLGNNLTLTLPGGHLIAADAGINPGTAGVPTLFFNGDSDTGIYRWGADRIGFTAGGSVRVTLGTTDTTFAVPVLAPAGTAAEPSYAFAGDTNTGIWRSAADRVDIATGGVNRLSIQNGNADFAVYATFNGNVGTESMRVTNRARFDDQISIPNLTTGVGDPLIRLSASTLMAVQTSSAAYKENIRDVEPNVSALLQLVPKRFDYINSPSKDVVGLMAEDAHDLGLSDLLNYNAQGLPTSFNQQAVDAHLLTALKQAYAQIAALAARIDALEIV